MKFSEMNNDQMSEAMIRISTPISNICDDEEAMQLMDQIQSMKDVSVLEAIGKLLPKIVLYAFRKHRNDLYEIVGALSMKKTAEVGKMNFGETVQLVKDNYEILSGFFTPSGKATKKTAGR